MTARKKDSPSYSLSRLSRAQINRHELTLSELGVRFADQHERALKRLHTFRSGERSEGDYAKHTVFLFPNASWSKPVMFQTGIIIDHHSGVIKGIDVTANPATASCIRLYRNSVLPKRLWLPPALAAKYADEWDVAGVERLIALDNDRALQSCSTTLMFVGLGVIVLRVPPKRGDLKGKVERTHYSLEKIFLEALDGYVWAKYRFTDHRSKHLIDRARAAARLTVAEYLELLVLAVLEFNRMEHPTFKRPRIQVYRDGLEHAPPILITGRQQIAATFALSYTRPITREGVQVENWFYNSPELGEWRSSARTEVIVRVDPDDVRNALVFRRGDERPLEVKMTTLSLPEPTPFELAKMLIVDESGVDDAVYEDGVDPALASRYWARFYELQTGRAPRAGARPSQTAQASAQATSSRPHYEPSSNPVTDDELDGIFGSGRGSP